MLCVLSMKKKHAHLYDASCITGWQLRMMGELEPCRGRCMAGALLQLVSKFGHLRAEWKKALKLLHFEQEVEVSYFSIWGSLY